MRQKKNMRVREALKKYDFTQWQLADLLGISTDTMCRRMRYELPEEEQDRYIALIKEASEHEAD